MEAAAAQLDVSLTHMDLDLALARFVAGTMRSEETPEVATELIARDLAGPDACELAALRQPTWRDARVLFEASLRASGLPLPSLEQAQASLVLSAVRRVAAGVEPAIVGVRELARWCYTLDYRSDLMVFYALDDDWDEYPAQRAAIAADMRKAAKEWLAEMRSPAG